MAILGVLALLCGAVAVYAGTERRLESVLITRRGRPVAALVPVGSEQAEAMILSSAPELIESRHRAENAIAEGRTTPLETALQHLDAEEAAQTTDMEATAKATSSYGYLVSEVSHPRCAA